MQAPEGIIFDMDGTLWDAVDTYAACWNLTFEHFGLDRHFTRDDLLHLMGQDSHAILRAVFPDFTDEQRTEAFHQVFALQDELQQTMGGVLYPGVKEGIIALSENYRLFMASNCEKNGLKLFLKWAGLERYVEDEITYGATFLPKHRNIRILMEKHNLQSAVYVGDTDTDSRESELAGIPFVYMAYGFGQTEHYALRFGSFGEFSRYFLRLKSR
jgi:phosphoglycolate phosphatase